MPEESQENGAATDSHPVITDEQMSSLAKIESTSLETEAAKEVEPAGTAANTQTEPYVAQTNPVTTEDKKPWLNEDNHHKSKKFVAIALLVMLLITGFGGWAAYAFWYQNPYKAMSDAIIGALSSTTSSAKGFASVAFDAGEFRIDFDGSAGYKEGYDVKAEGAYIPKDADKLSLLANIRNNEQGDTFFRVDKLKELFDIFIKATNEEMTKHGYSKKEIKQADDFYDQFYAPIIEKIDGKWFEASAEDIKEFDSESARSFECTQKVTADWSEHPEKLTEMAEKYLQNSFITIKEELGIVEGRMGYVVGISTSKLQDFVDAVKTTKFYKELKSCAKDDDTFVDDIDVGDYDDVDTQLWIDPWTHRLLRINGKKTTGKGDDKALVSWEINFSFNEHLKVETPKDTTPIKSLLPSVNDITDSVKTIIGTQSNVEKA